MVTKEDRTLNREQIEEYLRQVINLKLLLLDGGYYFFLYLLVNLNVETMRLDYSKELPKISSDKV